MEESSVYVGLESSVDSIQYDLACLNVMGSDLQLFLLIIYLILPMLKWFVKPRGFIILMRAELHQMAWKRTGKDKVMHCNVLAHLNPETVKTELVSQTPSWK